MHNSPKFPPKILHLQCCPLFTFLQDFLAIFYISTSYFWPNLQSTKYPPPTPYVDSIPLYLNLPLVPMLITHKIVHKWLVVQTCIYTTTSPTMSTFHYNSYVSSFFSHSSPADWTIPAVIWRYPPLFYILLEWKTQFRTDNFFGSKCAEIIRKS